MSKWTTRCGGCQGRGTHQSCNRAKDHGTAVPIPTLGPRVWSCPNILLSSRSQEKTMPPSFFHARGTQESRRSLLGQISPCPQAQLVRGSSTMG